MLFCITLRVTQKTKVVRELSGEEFTLEKAKQNSVVDTVHRKEDALLEDKMLSFRAMFSYVLLIRYGML